MAEFLEELEARLAALKAAELRAALMAHAETLAAAERGAYLGIFEAGAEGGKAGGKRRLGRGTGVESLLRDIDALVEKYGEGRHEGREYDLEEEGEDEEDDEDWDHYESAHNRGRCTISHIMRPYASQCATRCSGLAELIHLALALADGTPAPRFARKGEGLHGGRASRSMRPEATPCIGRRPCRLPRGLAGSARLSQERATPLSPLFEARRQQAEGGLGQQG